MYLITTAHVLAAIAKLDLHNPFSDIVETVERAPMSFAACRIRLITTKVDLVDLAKARGGDARTR